MDMTRASKVAGRSKAALFPVRWTKLLPCVSARAAGVRSIECMSHCLCVVVQTLGADFLAGVLRRRKRPDLNQYLTVHSADMVRSDQVRMPVRSNGITWALLMS